MYRVLFLIVLFFSSFAMSEDRVDFVRIKEVCINGYVYVVAHNGAVTGGVSIIQKFYKHGPTGAPAMCK